jgi:spiro-SPASM protein
MNLRVCIDATGLTSHATAPLGGGPGAVERVRTFAAALEHAEGVTILVDETTPEAAISGVRPIRREKWDTVALVGALKEATGEADAVLLCRADTPFLDLDVTARMLDSHHTYVSEYTFVDGYPNGIAPEIIDPRILDQLGTLAEKAPEPITQQALFSIIQKDINAFDVETELSPIDLRILRARLVCDTRRDYLLCDRIAAETDGTAAQITEVLQKKGEILRTLPAYTSIQVVEGEVQLPIHSPYRLIQPDALEVRGHMAADQFERFVRELAGFAPDGMLHISLWGEVGLHPDLPRLIATVEGTPELGLLVETSGVGWSEEALRKVAAMELRSTSFILDLDTDDPESYRKVRGAGFQEARRTADTLLEAHGSRVYVQAVRMQETEEQVEKFYRAWKDRGVNVIVQKYDHYCGRLPDRRVTDISPVNRFPCRHTQRDLNVLADGTVVMCREDLDREHVLGNVFEDGVEATWENGREKHVRQVRAEYPELCRRCDEYYTFNY